MKNVYAIAEPALRKVEKLKDELDSSPRLESDKLKIVGYLSSLFSKIVNEYMPKNRIIKILTAKEYSEIVYLKREYPQILDCEALNLFVDAYFKYFYYCTAKINRTMNSLNNTLEELEKIK